MPRAAATFIAFLRHHALYTAVAAYGLVAIVLHRMHGWDLFPPCLWTLAFGARCPGCGLTTATLHLLELDLAAAADANPLAFVILPTFAILAVKEYLGFARQTSSA